MPADRNAALVHRYFEECVSGASGSDHARAVAMVDELMTDDFVMFFNSDTDAEGRRGRQRHKEFLVGHAARFPDDDWKVDMLISNGSAAACQWLFRGRDAPTGNRVEIRAADFYTIRDGQLAELRRFLDFRELDRQTRPSRHRARSKP